MPAKCPLTILKMVQLNIFYPMLAAENIVAYHYLYPKPHKILLHHQYDCFLKKQLLVYKHLRK
jgi:hypothetical protein